MATSRNVKLVVYVPEMHADAVRQAMGNAGAGVIGNYTHCTFSAKGIGRFRAEDGAKPFLGKVGEVTAVSEERIETVCSRDRIKRVIEAIRKVHPYEEIAMDIYPLEDIAAVP